MHILYYYWTENSSEDILDCWREMGYTYTKITYPLTDYDSDFEFETQLEKMISESYFDFIFTFNYFPVLSKIADKIKIPYICWIYDCPHLTLYSKRAVSSDTYFFLFDREMCEMMKMLGALHVLHMPLAVNAARLSGIKPQRDLPDFTASFVGSLYENNLYRQISSLPGHLQGYLDGIINAQSKIQGENLLQELLTTDLTAQIQTYVAFEEHENYRYTAQDIFLSMLEAETTCRERIRLLDLAAKRCRTHLFTASNAALVPNCIPHGYISYREEMPRTFLDSKININISLRSIHSGIPLRCMDIMGAGGFLLSNFQPELCELFVPDEEFVCFFSEEEFTEKIVYFVEHETERREIAANGREKVISQFNYPHLFQKIIDFVFSAD